jgi:hypothetical protein
MFRTADRIRSFVLDVCSSARGWNEHERFRGNIGPGEEYGNDRLSRVTLGRILPIIIHIALLSSGPVLRALTAWNLDVPQDSSAF